jgi:hypothetical protein
MGEWPEAVVKSQEHEGPTVTLYAGEAAALSPCRRGFEPIQIVIMSKVVSAVSAGDHLAHRADVRGRVTAAEQKRGFPKTTVYGRGRHPDHDDAKCRQSGASPVKRSYRLRESSV